MKGKRILSFILAFVMVLGMIPFNALEIYAASSVNTDPAWRNGTYVIEAHNSASSVTKKQLLDLLEVKWDTVYSKYGTYGGFKYGTTELKKSDNSDSAGLAVNTSYDVYNATAITQGGTYIKYDNGQTWSTSPIGTFTVEVYDVLTINTVKDGSPTTDYQKIFRGGSYDVVVTEQEGYNLVVSKTVDGVVTRLGTTAGTYTISGLDKDATVTVEYALPTDSTFVAGSVANNVTVKVNNTEMTSTGVTIKENTSTTVSAVYTGSDKNTYVNSVSVLKGTETVATGVGSATLTTAASATQYTVNATTDVAIKLSGTEIQFNSTDAASVWEQAIKDLVKVCGNDVADSQLTITYLGVDLRDGYWYPLGESGELDLSFIPGLGTYGYYFGDADTETVKIVWTDGTTTYERVETITLTESRQEATVELKDSVNGVYEVLMNGYWGEASNMPAADHKELVDAIYNAVVKNTTNHDGTVTIKAYDGAGVVKGWYDLSDDDSNFTVDSTEKIMIFWSDSEQYADVNTDEITISVVESRSTTTVSYNGNGNEEYVFVENPGDTLAATIKNGLKDGFVITCSDNSVITAENENLTVSLPSDYAFPDEGVTVTVNVTVKLNETTAWQASNEITVPVTIRNITDVNGNGIHDAVGEDTYHTITWMNGDAAYCDPTSVLTKMAPTAPTGTPGKTADKQYTYVFAGWDVNNDGVADDLSALSVTSDLTAKAVYTNVTNTYKVTWVDADGTELEVDAAVEYGATPEYNDTKGTTAQLAAAKNTAQYTYTFAGWTPEIGTVTGEITYKATYTNQVNKYTITWVNGTTVTEEYEYGRTPKKELENYTENGVTYTFLGWSTDSNATEAMNLPTVTGDETYYAVYAEAAVVYVVTYTGEGFEDHKQNVVYGGTAAGYTVSRPGYEFVQWNDEDGNKYDFATILTGDITLTAVWQKVWTITFVDNGATVHTDPKVNEGTTIAAAKALYTVTDTDTDGVVFKGWTANVEGTTVTSDVTFTAVWGTDSDNDGYEDGSNEDPYYTVQYYDEKGANSWITVDDKLLNFTPVTSNLTEADGSALGLVHATAPEGMVFDYWMFFGIENDTTVKYYAQYTIDCNKNGIADKNESITLSVEGEGAVSWAEGELILLQGNAYVYDSTKDYITITATPNDTNNGDCSIGYVKAAWARNTWDTKGDAVTSIVSGAQTLNVYVSGDDNVTVQFAVRTIDVKDAPYEIEINKGMKPSAQVDALYNAILAAAINGETSGATVEIYVEDPKVTDIFTGSGNWFDTVMNWFSDDAGWYDIYATSTLPDWLGGTTSAVKANYGFKGDTQKIRVTFPATATEPAVSYEFTVKLKDSRTSLNNTVAVPESQKLIFTATSTEQTIKDKALTAANLPSDAVVGEITTNLQDVTLTHSEARNVTVTIKVTGDTKYQPSTITVTVPVQNEAVASPLAYTPTTGGTVVFFNSNNETITQTMGGTVKVVITPDIANGYYVTGITVNGTPVTGTYDATTCAFTAAFDTESNVAGGYTVTVAYAQRQLGDADTHGTVSMNGYYLSHATESDYQERIFGSYKANVLNALGIPAAQHGNYTVKVKVSDRYIDVAATDIISRGQIVYSMINDGAPELGTAENPAYRQYEITLAAATVNGVAMPAVTEVISLGLVESRGEADVVLTESLPPVEIDKPEDITVQWLKDNLDLVISADASGDVTAEYVTGFPTEEGQTANVTVRITVAENDKYLKTVKEFTFRVTNKAYLTYLNIPEAIRDQVVLQDAEGNKLALENGVYALDDGTYTVTVTPDSANYQYVEAVLASGYGVALSEPKYENCKYVVTLNVANHTTQATNATLNANLKTREIVLNNVEFVVPYETYTNQGVKSVFDLVVNTANGFTYADGAVALVGELKPGYENTFLLTWAADEKCPAITKEVAVKIASELVPTEVTVPTATLTAQTQAALEIDVNEIDVTTGELTDAAKTAILAVLKENHVDLVNRTDDVEPVLTIENWPTITTQGQTATATVKVEVAEANGFAAATAEFTVTLNGKVEAPKVILVQPVGGGTISTASSNVETGTYTFKLTPAADYFVDSLTVSYAYGSVINQKDTVATANAETTKTYTYLDGYFTEAGTTTVVLANGTGYALGVVPAYSVTAEFIDPSIVITAKDGKMTYYPKMFGDSMKDEGVYEALEKLVMDSVEVTDVPTGLTMSGTNEIKYMARPADTYHVSFTIEIPFIGAKTLSGDIPMENLWLSIGEDFPTDVAAPSQETVQGLFDDILEEYGLTYLMGLLDNEEERNKFVKDILMKDPDIANYVTYYGAHEFGANEYETIKLINTSDRFDAVESNSVQLHLEDDRKETNIVLKQDHVEMIYGFTEEQLTAAILEGVYTADGTPVEGATVKYITSVKGLTVAEDAYTITISYPGKPLEYQACTATFTLTVNKADVQVSVDNRLIKWEENLTYELPVIVNPDDCEVITFIVGLNISNVNFEGAKIQGIMGEVQLMIPESLNSVMQTVGIKNGMSMTVSELKDLLLKAAEGLGYVNSENEVINVLLNMLESLPTDVADITVRIGGNLPTDIGVYLVGAVSADANYNMDYAIGAVVITPDGVKVDLAWNQNDDNYIVTNTLLTTKDTDGKYLFDTAAYATAVGEGGNLADATAQIVELFMGVDIDGNITLETDQTKLNVGAYVEVAMTADWGNTMYYSRPIARPIVVVAETLDVDFVDASGAVNNERHFEFFNVPQDGMEGNLLVTYKKDGNGYKAGDKVENYNVKYFYVGVQTNAMPYASTTAPTHAGAYTITAIVTVRDGDTITHAGQGIGALVIEPSKSTTDVENEAIKWDGSEHTVNQFVDVNSVNVPGLKPDKTVISAGIHADLDANIGLEAIKGSVNIDMPTWMDELMKKFGVLEAGYADGITVTEFKSYVEKLEAELVELGVETDAFAKIVNVVNQLSDNVTLTFHDDKGYSEVGAYLIVGIVTDSDHYPSADAGIMVIYPDATKVDLKFNKTWDGNNVFTWDVLKTYDLNAKAYTLGTETVNEEATAEVTNLFVGFADHGELVLTTNDGELDNGVYAQVAFILQLDNVLYYAEPIAREVIIVPNPATIDFVDDNGNVNNERHFEFFNVPHAMDKIRVTLADGQVLDLTAADEGVDIYYVGVMLNGQPYAGYDAPVHAGVYEVTAQYTARDDQNRVVNLGVGAGVLVIEPSKSETAVDNAAYPYGEAHSVRDLIHASSVNVPTITPDTTVISAGLSTNLDTVSGLESINGTVNVDLPTWLDEVFAKLNVLEAGYADGISAETFLSYVEKIEAGLVELGVETESFDEIVNVVKQLPITTNLTFHDDIAYTEVGAYLVIAVVTDSDHYPSVGAGIMVIYPDATKVELQFEEDWNGNNIFTWHALENMNLEAKAYLNGAYCEPADQKVVNLYFGFTDNGEFLLETVAYGEHLKDLPEFDNGLYTQMALVNDFGNVMYYAKPISRTFLVVPNPAVIEFIDEAGNVNADRHFIFNNAEHAMDVRVTVNGVVLTDLTGLTVTYTGVQTNGELYNDTVAPKHSGAYVVTATYTARDAQDRLVTMGVEIGAMVIEPAKAEINVDNTAHEYDGNTVNTGDMVHINSGIGGYNPNATIITAGIKTDGTFSENLLDAINSEINIDLPDWADKLLAKVDGTQDGITVAGVIAAIEKAEAKLAELAAEVGVEVEEDAFDGLTAILKQLPANYTVTFNDAPAYKEVGAYLVIGVVTDSNCYPAMDAGVLVIYPDVDEAKLNWIYEDSNNIFTLDTLAHVNLGAYATVDGAVNNAVPFQILYLGVNANTMEIVLTRDQSDLTVGNYTEIAYVLDVDSQMYVAEPIIRNLTIVQNVYEVLADDATYTYDGTGKIIDPITVLNQAKEDITAKGELTVTYMGLSSGLEISLGQTAPVNAGIYKAVITFVTYDEDGYITGAGSKVVDLTIKRADPDFDVTDAEFVYDGTEKSHGLMNTHGVDYIAVIETEDGVNLVLTDGLQKLADFLGDEIYDLSSLKEAIEKAINVVEGLNLDSEFVDKLLATIEEVNDSIIYKITVNGANPVDAGTYKAYAITVPTANFGMDVSEGTLVILPKQITSVEVTSTHTYNGSEQTVTFVVKAGDEVLTVSDYIVTGNKGTNAGDYTLTVTGTGNYTGTVEVEWNIAKKEITAADVALDGTLTYNGAEQTQNITVTDGVTYTVTGNKGTNAGDYTLTVTGTGNYTGTVEVEWNIAKTDATVTAPTANELTYTGAAQALVTAGTANGGTMLYSLDGQTWSEEIPTGTEVGQYTVYYYVKGDENHSDSEVGSVVVTIAKANVKWAANAQVGNSLALYLAFNIPELDDITGHYAVITRTYADGKANQIVTVNSDSWKTMTMEGEQYYYVKYDPLAAKEMTDELHIQIFDENGNAITEVYTESMQTYAMRMLNKHDTKSDTSTIYAQLLVYGTAAQNYFGYNLNDLADAEMTDLQKTFAMEDIAFKTEGNEVEGLNYVASNLQLQSTIKMYLKFTGIESAAYAKVSFTNHKGQDVSVTIDAAEFKFGGTAVMIDELVAADYNVEVNCTIYDAQGNILAYATDSVENYIGRNYANHVLYEELLKYMVAAYNYFH